MSTLGIKGKWKNPAAALNPQCQPRPCPMHGPKIKTATKWRCLKCEQNRQWRRKLGIGI